MWPLMSVVEGPSLDLGTFWGELPVQFIWCATPVGTDSARKYQVRICIAKLRILVPNLIVTFQKDVLLSSEELQNQVVVWRTSLVKN